MQLLTPKELKELIKGLKIAERQLTGCAAWLSSKECNQGQVALGTINIANKIHNIIEKYQGKYNIPTDSDDDIMVNHFDTEFYKD